MDERSKARYRELIPIWGVGIFVLLLIVIAVCFFISQSRTNAHRDAEVATANLSRTLAQNIKSTVDRLDISLQAIQDGFLLLQQHDESDRDRVLSLIQRNDDRNPYLTGFRIFGADGKLRFALKNVADPNADISEEEDFKRLRSDPKAGLVVSPPVFGKSSKLWIIRMSRRINNPDGSFGGMVTSAIPIATLIKTFSDLNLGAQGTLAIYHSSFRLAARYPENQSSPNPIGSIAISTKLKEIIQSGVAQTQYDYESVIDHVGRTANVMRVEGLPYWVLVGIAENDYLEEWWRDTYAALLLGGMAIVLVFVAVNGFLRRALDRMDAEDERSKIEFDLRSTASRLALVLGTAAEGIISFDDQMLVMFATPAAANILKWPSAEAMTGKTSVEVTGHLLADGSPCSATTCRIRSNVSKAETARISDEFFTARDGTVIPVEFVVSPQVGCGHVVGVVVAFHDIIERKALDAELKRSNAELAQFAYVASHDLRQPVRTVISYLSLIEKKLGPALDVELKKYLGFASNGARRMDKLIVDLLEYSRSGRQTETLDLIPLGAVVGESLQNLSSAITDTHSTVLVGDELPTIFGCRSDLTRLMQNLIGNAVKYRHPDHFPEITIGSRDDNDRWLVWVQDNGVGIPPEFRERVFNMFQRLVPKETIEGTGIGLALCKKIVEQHGGKIWIEDAPESGCLFMMEFPKSASA